MNNNTLFLDKAKTSMKTTGQVFGILAITAALATSAHAQTCFPPPSGAIGWWSGDGNANDNSGNNLNGVLVNGTSFAPGVVGDAFHFNAASSNYVQVPTADSLNPAQGQGWTVEAWIYLATNDLGSFIIAHKGDTMGTTDPYDDGQQGFWMFCLSGLKLWWSTGHTGSNAQVSSSTNEIIPNQWSHVAVVVTGFGDTNAGFAFYINGSDAGTSVAYENSVASMTTTEPLRIGCGKAYYPTSYLTGFFQGQIDELAIYNRALSGSEIAAIYSAGGAGKCKGLFMTSQPQGQVGYRGQSATFSVGVSGDSPPFSYQWLKGGVPMLNATNSILVLTNLQFTDADAYSVIVSDSVSHSITSASANLIVNTASVSVGMYPGVPTGGGVGQYPGITISGAAGNDCIVQGTTDLSNTNSWTTLANLTLTQPVQLWVDTNTDASLPANAQHFYRVLAGQ
jgi:hypothetical protein